MVLELILSPTLQVTLEQAVLDHLGVKPGDKLGVSLLPRRRVELTAISAGHDLSSVRGALRREGPRIVPLGEMREAVEAGRRG